MTDREQQIRDLVRELTYVGGRLVAIQRAVSEVMTELMQTTEKVYALGPCPHHVDCDHGPVK